MSVALRAGLVGLGAMGRNHLRVLSALEDVEFVGVADPAVAPKDGPAGVNLYPSVSELLNEHIDMCVVAVPTKFHASIAAELAEAGVATLIEKPLADSPEVANHIADIFEKAGVLGCVGHIERFNPAVQELRSRLSHGQLGDVYQVSTQRIGPFPSRIADVGVIFDLAVHDIDLTAWITGQKYEEVAALSTFKSGRAFEDLVSVTGGLTDGTVVSHLVNWLSPFKQRQVVVTGEMGALRADTLTADLTYFANGNSEAGWDALSQFRGVAQGDVTTYAFPKKEPLLAELEAFRDAAMGIDNRTVSLRDGAATVATAQRIVESASAHRVTRATS